MIVPCGASGKARCARSAVGVVAYTSRIVSLNCRIDEKPAAKATSDAGSAVRVSRMRAVSARFARASANGAAPSSAASILVRCRSE